MALPLYMNNLLFVEFWFPVVASLCEWVSVFVSVECEEADRETQGVQHLVFDRRQQNVQLLRLRRYGTRAQVGVPSYGPKKNQTDADKISGCSVCHPNKSTNLYGSL